MTAELVQAVADPPHNGSRGRLGTSASSFGSNAATRGRAWSGRDRQNCRGPGGCRSGRTRMTPGRRRRADGRMAPVTSPFQTNAVPSALTAPRPVRRRSSRPRTTSPRRCREGVERQTATRVPDEDGAVVARCHHYAAIVVPPHRVDRALVPVQFGALTGIQGAPLESACGGCHQQHPAVGAERDVVDQAVAGELACLAPVSGLTSSGTPPWPLRARRRPSGMLGAAPGMGHVPRPDAAPVGAVHVEEDRVAVASDQQEASTVRRPRR